MSRTLSADMIPIPIDEVITGLGAPVDIYIRLSQEKFILICKAGQKAEKKQLKSYQSKEVNYLWVDRNTYYKMAQQNIAIAGIVVGKSALSLQQKTNVVSSAASSVFNELNHMGVNLDFFDHSKQITDAVVSISEHRQDLSELFGSLARYSDNLLKHSVAVSAFSVILGQAMGWENRSTLEKLGLGGLLHDIGKKALPREILEKPRAAMSYDEMQIYETHPFKGVQLLQSIGVVPDDVTSIVYEHHENSIGQGFPQKLRNLKIHPMARVVALADEFINLTMASPQFPYPRSSREALIYIEHTMGQPHNREAFRALKAIVGEQDERSSA